MSARSLDMVDVRRPVRNSLQLLVPLVGLAGTIAISAIAIKINPATLPLIALGFLLFAPLEMLFPRRRQSIAPKTTLVNLAHVTMTTTLTTALMSASIGLVAAIPTIPTSASWIASLPAPLALLVVVLAGDTGYYWTHRAAHEVPMLWRLHRIHHASEELNWMSATRAHPLDQLLLHLGWLIPLRLLGANAAWFAVYAIFLTAEPLLAHSNINIKLKPLKWLIVTPEFHHWHHTAEPDAINKNFASQLPILDFLFGTWWLPKNRRIARYGIDEPMPESYVGQLVAPGVDAVAYVRKRVAPSSQADSRRPVLVKPAR